MKTAKNGKLKSVDESDKHKVIYVFQGGGALGSFQVGVFDALHELNYLPNMVVGISIGGINAAIIAGNKPEDRSKKLHEFWDIITTSEPFADIFYSSFSEFYNFLGANHAVLQGQDGFFTPKLIKANFVFNETPDNISFYDTSPLRETLEGLIDFDYLNNGTIRLCLGSTNLRTGEFKFFDSKNETITLDHIMASGALPPGFPAVKIEEEYYVDGGVFANTPLFKVFDEFSDVNSEIDDVLCFVIDLFPSIGKLPTNFNELMTRLKDIQYSSHSKRTSSLFATTGNMSKAIHFLGSQLTAEQKQDPNVKEVLKLGRRHWLNLVRIIYRSKNKSELESKDYNFNRQAADLHCKEGYKITKDVVGKRKSEWQMQKDKDGGYSIYTLDENDKLKKITV